ncbi:hypothetical protein ACFLTZ_02785 [Chloroflexota bacterium]
MLMVCAFRQVICITGIHPSPGRILRLLRLFLMTITPAGWGGNPYSYQATYADSREYLGESPD